ncbi:hypothetical protein MTsPCn9_25870 [Croceitalea sp. MTPC9]|uniref:hypothetical protein n=1 Tax=unclassified Croceitalea TaxID=2632280 RepID=UPI002B3A91A7|nr:hypothetical protein MTsPCn6_28660 [Croceitalea sp. MTPC6]GMN17649.1 hypothetical protein MTsPCn9_25870 [Croceitalea sp. MTPC9]
MRKFLFFFFLLSLVSCEYFRSQEKQTEQIVNDELLAIDWNDVDQYPLFENCDENATKEAQRNCFQVTMLSYFATAFDDLEFEVEKDINDTLHIDFLIDEHGFMTVLEIQEKDNVNKVLPQLKEEFSKRLNDLTTVAPALKRSTPVSVKFRLPIVLNTTN